MTQNELDDIMTLIDQAMGHISSAVEKLEELDRIKFIDVSDYMNRLMDVGADLELELDSMEDEVVEND